MSEMRDETGGTRGRGRRRSNAGDKQHRMVYAAHSSRFYEPLDDVNMAVSARHVESWEWWVGRERVREGAWSDTPPTPPKPIDRLHHGRDLPVLPALSLLSTGTLCRTSAHSTSSKSP